MKLIIVLTFSVSTGTDTLVSTGTDTSVSTGTDTSVSTGTDIVSQYMGLI
ncbi:MAG: hypothetical protein ACM3PT_06420 [Deltaproteobacteria bacterium]